MLPGIFPLSDEMATIYVLYIDNLEDCEHTLMDLPTYVYIEKNLVPSGLWEEQGLHLTPLDHSIVQFHFSDTTAGGIGSRYCNSREVVGVALFLTAVPVADTQPNYLWCCHKYTHARLRGNPCDYHEFRPQQFWYPI